MAVAALLLWLCTAAVGSYLLVTAARAAGGVEQPEPAEAVKVPDASDLYMPSTDKDRYAPPSLQRAKSEPIPGLKALAEFAHPALGMIGFGVWLGYVVSRHQVMAEIGLGVLLGTIAAGISWFLANKRAAKRIAAGEIDATAPGAAPLTASSRVLVLHGAGAGLTLLFALLITLHV
jgi:hypothetical protein